RRLAAPGRSADDDHAVRGPEQAPEQPVARLVEAELVEAEERAALVEQAEHDLLAPDRLRRRDPDVDRAVVGVRPDLAVLGPAAAPAAGRTDGRAPRPRPAPCSARGSRPRSPRPARAGPGRCSG